MAVVVPTRFGEPLANARETSIYSRAFQLSREIQKSRRHGERVLELFHHAASFPDPDLLECVKHCIAREETDFRDLGDLINELPLHIAQRVLQLFITVAAPSVAAPLTQSRYSTIVISDLDNTVIENEHVCPVYYAHNDIIPGFIPFAKALTRDGSTTLTFISARPSSIEAANIVHVKHVLQSRGMPPSFAFQSGKLPATLWYSASRVTGSEACFDKAAQMYATTKYEVYLRLCQLFPFSRFVFFGDDTQGDAIFAKWFVEHRQQQNYAFIRCCTAVANGFRVQSESPFITYHTSYYEAIVRASPRSFGDPSVRETAAAYALEEYHRHYLPSLNAGRFKNPELAAALDAKWFPQLRQLASNAPPSRTRFY